MHVIAWGVGQGMYLGGGCSEVLPINKAKNFWVPESRGTVLSKHEAFSLPWYHWKIGVETNKQINKETQTEREGNYRELEIFVKYLIFQVITTFSFRKLPLISEHFWSADIHWSITLVWLYHPSLPGWDVLHGLKLSHMGEKWQTGWVPIKPFLNLFEEGKRRRE
jgi:hypothetical protein